MATLRFDGSLWCNLDIALRNLDQVYGRVTQPLDLSIIEFYIVRTLMEQDGRHASDLAQAVGRAATSFTPLLDSLERKDLITRRPDPADRRAVFIHLTEEGEALRRRIQSSAEQVEEAVRGGASKEDWAAFEHVLARLVQLNTAEELIVGG